MRTVAVVATLGMLAGDAYAEPPPTPLTEEWVVASALRDHPAIGAARARVRSARAGVAQAWALPDPMLTVEGFPAYRFGEDSPGMLMYMASQSIPLGSERSHAARAARGDTRGAQAELETARLDVALAARLAFVRFAEAAAIRATREDELALLRDASEIVRARIAAGAESASDALGLEAALAEAEASVVAAQGGEKAARTALSAFVGLPRGTSLPVPASLVLPPEPRPLASVLEASRRARPELRGLAALAEAARQRASAARARGAPVLTVGLGYMQDFSMPDGIWAQVGVSLPVWARARAGAVSQAEQEAAALVGDSASLERTLSAEIASVHAELVAARERARLVETRLVPRAEARRDLAILEYARGQTDLFGLLDAVRGRLNSRLDLVRAVAEAVRGRALLERAVGR